MSYERTFRFQFGQLIYRFLTSNALMTRHPYQLESVMFGQLNTDSVTGQLNGCTPNKQGGYGHATHQAVSRRIATATARVRTSGSSSSPSQVIWDFLRTKRHWRRFSPSISVCLVAHHHRNRLHIIIIIIITIYDPWRHNRPNDGWRTKCTQSLHPTLKKR
jgi:hypothetical protein